MSITTMKVLDADGATRVLRMLADSGGNLTPLSRPPVQEVKTHSDLSGSTVTFSAAVDFVTIVNADASNDGVFTVNGIAIPVRSLSSFSDAIGGTPSATITVATATTFIILRHA